MGRPRQELSGDPAGNSSASTRAFPMGAGPGGRMKAGAGVCGEGGRPDARGA